MTDVLRLLVAFVHQDNESMGRDPANMLQRESKLTTSVRHAGREVEKDLFNGVRPNLQVAS